MRHIPPLTPMKQSEQDSSVVATAEACVGEDVIDMTMPMESPSSADAHEHHSAATEVVATDTSRNIQAYMGPIKMTGLLLRSTSVPVYVVKNQHGRRQTLHRNQLFLMLRLGPEDGPALIGKLLTAMIYHCDLAVPHLETNAEGVTCTLRHPISDIIDFSLALKGVCPHKHDVPYFESNN